MIASLNPLTPVIVSSRRFNKETKVSLSFFVISLTFLCSGIPDNSTITGISFFGKRLSKEFTKSLLSALLKSFNTL